MLRQVVTRTVDEDRLLPTIDKQRSTVRKKLDRMVEGKGWYVSLLRKAYSAEFLPEAAGRARVSGRDAAFAGWQ